MRVAAAAMCRAEPDLLEQLADPLVARPGRCRPSWISSGSPIVAAIVGAGRATSTGPGRRSACRAGRAAQLARASSLRDVGDRRSRPRRGRLDEPQHEPRDRRLARAALTDEPERLAARAIVKSTPSTARTCPITRRRTACCTWEVLAQPAAPRSSGAAAGVGPAAGASTSVRRLAAAAPRASARRRRTAPRRDAAVATLELTRPWWRARRRLPCEHAAGTGTVRERVGLGTWPGITGSGAPARPPAASSRADPR